MAVDCGTAYALAQFVKLVAEVPHIRGVVFVSGNDLVDRINDDSFVSLVLYCVNQLGNKIVKRLGLPLRGSTWMLPACHISGVRPYCL